MSVSSTSPPQLPSDDEPQINPTLKRKVQKVLESSTDDDELILALKNLSTFYGKNTIHTRWQLRDQLEKRSLAINAEFLQAFSAIETEVNLVQRDIEEIKKSCDKMEARLADTKKGSGRLIQQAQSLFTDEADTALKADVLHSFLEKYQLTAQEEKHLKSQDVSKEFFAALRRAQQIQSDCKILLRSPNQRAGLEILDAMAELLEGLYKKLYRWIRAESKVFESDYPDVSPFLSEAFQALQERPVLMNYCLEEIGTTRNKTLVKAYIDALTKGGPNGVPRPIEMQAHDPRRFVGDMAAWLHQALAGEQEMCSSMLRLLRRETEEEKFQLKEFTGKVMTAAFNGVCRPFKLRIDQILSSGNVSPMLSYQLANLLYFYKQRFLELTRQDNPLVGIFEESRVEALAGFDRLLSQKGSKYKANPPTAPSDLSPSHELRELLTVLVDVMSIFDTSLVPVEQREVEFSPTLNSIVAILQETARLSSTASRLGRMEQSIYLINSYNSVVMAMQKYDFTRIKVDQMNVLVELEINTVVQEQVGAILKQCGLAAKLAILHYTNTQNPVPVLSQVPGMDLNALSVAFRAFEASLLDLGTLNLPLISRLESATLRLKARTTASKLITEAYVMLYNAVMDPKNGFERPENLVRYKPEQVQAMIEP